MIKTDKRSYAVCPVADYMLALRAVMADIMIQKHPLPRQCPEREPRFQQQRSVADCMVAESQFCQEVESTVLAGAAVSLRA